MDPARLVFFGMDGPFSRVALDALVGAGLTPVLVVQGEHAPRGGWRLDALLSIGAILRRGRPRHDLTTHARGQGIEAISVTDPSSLRARARIRSVRPHALVVAGFPTLLPKLVLDLAAIGGLNVHPGHLPEERGPSPIFWALKRGQRQLGYAIHMLDQGEDTGDVVARGQFEPTIGADEQELLEQCARSAAPNLVESVKGLLAGEIVGTRQASVGAGRCPRPSFRDGRIDATLPAEAVYSFVAGCARTHSLFVESGGDRFFVAAAVAYERERTLPSEYVLRGDSLLLACRPGVVELELRRDGALFSAEYGPAES